MPFQFPANPTLGQVFESLPGISYKWNGTGWTPVSPTYFGGVTFTAPVLFPDGTLNAPGISWANDSNSGFYKDPTGGHIAYSVDGAAKFAIKPASIVSAVQHQFADGYGGVPGIAWATGTDSGFFFSGGQTAASIAGVTVSAFHSGGLWVHAPGQLRAAGNFYCDGTAGFSGAINASASVNLARFTSIWGMNTDNTANWDMLHAGGDNRLHVGRTGWPETIIYASAVNRLHVHAGGTNFTGTVAGITSAMVGLGSVLNNQQVYNFAPANASISLAWDGAWIQYSLNGGAGSITWPISITGTARSMWTPDGVTMNFRWVGTGGTPAWLWGTAGDASIYLYNPANFSVNYATTAGKANAVNDISGWSYSNRNYNPPYLWATAGSASDQFLVGPGNLSVNYANSVGTINGATLGSLSGGQLILNGTTGVGGTASYTQAALVINSANSSYVPSISMHYSGVSAWMLSQYSTDFLIGGNSNSGPGVAGGGAMQMQQAGNIYARSFNPGTMVLRDATPLTGALLKTLKLRGVRGFNEETNRPDICIELDDLELEFPEVVNRLDNEDGTLRGKGINYMLLTAPIIEALRELNERLTALENAP